MRGVLGAVWIAIMVAIVVAVTAVPDRQAGLYQQQGEGQASFQPPRERTTYFN